MPSASDANPLAPRAAAFPAAAKRVIFLFMHGGPSRIDTFDPKPRLDRRQRQAAAVQAAADLRRRQAGPADEVAVGVQARTARAASRSAICSRTCATCVDDLCVIRSMVGDGVDHGAALLQTFTGTSTFTRPSMGSWVLYGLGSENRNLPGFITIKPALSHGGAKNWGSAFLPGAYQGTRDRPRRHEGRRHQRRADRIPAQQGAVDASSSATSSTCCRTINRRHAELRKHDPQLEARIQSFELAFRMQTRGARSLRGREGIRSDQEALRPRRPDDRAISAGSACWRAGWPSAACASSSARTATSGTSTPTSSKSTPRTPKKWISRSPGCSPT